MIWSPTRLDSYPQGYHKNTREGPDYHLQIGNSAQLRNSAICINSHFLQSAKVLVETKPLEVFSRVQCTHCTSKVRFRHVRCAFITTSHQGTFTGRSVRVHCAFSMLGLLIKRFLLAHHIKFFTSKPMFVVRMLTTNGFLLAKLPILHA